MCIENSILIEIAFINFYVCNKDLKYAQFLLPLFKQISLLSITEAVGRKKEEKLRHYVNIVNLMNFSTYNTRSRDIWPFVEWVRKREKKRFHIFIETDLIYFLFNNREVCISCQGRRVLCMDFCEWLVNSPCHRKVKQQHETSHRIRWCHYSDTLSVQCALAARPSS